MFCAPADAAISDRPSTAAVVTLRIVIPFKERNSRGSTETGVSDGLGALVAQTPLVQQALQRIALAAGDVGDTGG